MQTEIQAETRYETPKTRYLTPKTRYGQRKSVRGKKKSVRDKKSRYGQWPTQKREEKLGTRQERKSVWEAKNQHKRENKKNAGNSWLLAIFCFFACFLLNICLYFVIICMEYLQEYFSKPQMQSPQSWLEPP